MLQIMGANAKNLDFCPDFSKSIFSSQKSEGNTFKFQQISIFYTFSNVNFSSQKSEGGKCSPTSK